MPTNLNELSVGIAVSTWNSDITSLLLEGAINTLLECGINPSKIIKSEVPGAFELPLAAQWLFEFKNVDAVIALGCVIKGDTPHFEYVCEGTTQGIMNTGLKYNRPCIYGLITTLNHQQALDRCGGTHGHKGIEAAQTALSLLQLKQNLIKSN